ncbi:MAG: right-handed parallel beta-helix repeat-containing protein [Actinomycetia bacterium]|nr:right-handed parallel beta-helix repeat-containing protein [Actinomycetes bacterium]
MVCLLGLSACSNTRDSTFLPPDATLPRVVLTTSTTTTTVPPAQTTRAPDPTILPPSETGTWYVDTAAGSDSNIGSELQPLQTISRALKLIAGRDTDTTIMLMSGSYHEGPIDVRWARPTDALLTIRAAGGATPAIQSPAGSDGFRIEGSHHVSIQGISLLGSPEGQNGNGVLVGQGSNQISVVDNVITGYAGGGVSVVRADGVTIAGNTISGNAKRSHLQTSGISLFDLEGGSDDELYDNQIFGNVVFGNENTVTRPDGKVTDGNCVIIDQLRRTEYQGSTLVANNLCVNNGGRGFHVFNSARVDVIHNTLVGNLTTDSIDAGELTAFDALDVRFINNLIQPREVKRAAYVARSHEVQFVGNRATGNLGDLHQGDAQLPALLFEYAVEVGGFGAWYPPDQPQLLVDDAGVLEDDLVGASRRGPATVGALESP